MAHFEKRSIEENTWFPEICGVSFKDKLYRFLGEVALDGTELYTVFFVDDDHEEQVTPETARIFLSGLDDDSDTISVFDRRDGLWFQFMRLTLGENFGQIATLIQPWSTVTTGLTPHPDVYQRYVEQLTKDTEADDLHVPDDWL